MPTNHISSLRVYPGEKVSARREIRMTLAYSVYPSNHWTCKFWVFPEGWHKKKMGKERTMYLNQSKDHKHKNGTKQEGTQEIEIIASLCRPECVESETYNYNSC